MPEYDPWAASADARTRDRWRYRAENWGSMLTHELLEFAELRKDSLVLDLASGSGDPALAIAARLREGRVVAIDNSGRGLLLAKRQSEAKGLKSHIHFVQADVHKLPFRHSCFDRATCRLGVMFFADIQAALSEILRVLKPGGRASFLAWDRLEQPFFESTVCLILRMVPGATIPDPARAMFRFARLGSLEGVLSRAGFDKVRERHVTLPRIWAGTADELWEYFQEVSTPFHPLIESIPPAVRPAIDESARIALARFQQDNGITVPTQLVLAAGHR